MPRVHQLQTGSKLALHGNPLLRRQRGARARRHGTHCRAAFADRCRHETCSHQLIQQVSIVMRPTARRRMFEHILISGRAFGQTDVFRDARGADFVAITLTQLTLDVHRHAPPRIVTRDQVVIKQQRGIRRFSTCSSALCMRSICNAPFKAR